MPASYPSRARAFQNNNSLFFIHASWRTQTSWQQIVVHRRCKESNCRTTFCIRCAGGWKKGETRSNAVPVEARHQSATTKGTSVNAAPPPCPLTIEIMIPGPSGHPGLHGTVDWRFCVQNTRITSLVNLFGHIRKNIHWKNAGKCGSDEG